MKKSRQLTGMGILDMENGKIIGKVSSAVFYPGRKKLLGFTVNCGKWIKKKKALFMRDIENIGTDMVVAKKGSSPVDLDDYPEFSEAIKEGVRILNLDVVTNKGERIGRIEDIIIDEKNCTVEGYVLTDGIVEDIMSGKSIIPFGEEMIFGEDVVIINDDYKNIMLKNDISLKKHFNSVGR